MTIYTTDFSEYTTGVNLSDWTDFWGDGTATYHAELNTGIDAPQGTKQLEYVKASDARNVITWDDVGSITNVDIITKIQISGADFDAADGPRIHARVSGTSGNENSYFCTIDDNEFKIIKYVNGAVTTINSIFLNVNFTPKNSFYIRFNITGTTIKAKLWSYFVTEPYHWNLEITDSDLTSGYVGIGGYKTITDYEIDYISIDDSGASAELPNTSTNFQSSVMSTASTFFLNATRYMGGYNTTANKRVIGAQIYCASTHADQVRLALYSGGAATNPTGATLVKDFGQTSGIDINQFIQINLAPGEYFDLPTNTYLWIGLKSDNSAGFESILVDNTTTYGPGNAGSFQSARGRYDDPSTSSDPTVAWPSTIPSGGSFANFWYSVGLIIEDSIDVLTVNDSSQFQEANNLILTSVLNLIPNNSNQLQESLNLTIFVTEDKLLTINNTTQLQQAQSLTLQQAIELGIINTEQLQSAGLIHLTTIAGVVTVDIKLKTPKINLEVN